MDREHYLRVTQVLYPFTGLDKIPPDVLANAARRGTRVHNICEAIAEGLGEMDIDDETRGYVNSFKQWWEQGHDVVLIEERFWDDDLQITGQVDFIINTPDGLAIVDLKTSSSVSKSWEGQGSAYAYLAKKSGYDIKKVIFVHLMKNGEPARLHEYPVDDSFFLSILRVYKHFFHRIIR